MVVQSRTIQNPATSGPALTTHLVNGLVNDGIISAGQAASIQTSVLQQLVTPTGSPTISGRVVASSVHPSASVEVDITLTDTGTGTAASTNVTQLTLKTLTGTGSVTLNSPGLPLTIGNLAVGASTTVKLFLNVPSTVKRFTVTENGTVQDIMGRLFNFSTGQQVIVQ
jgi:methenyltetrahydromethanopterin cyclohydrolase